MQRVVECCATYLDIVSGLAKGFLQATSLVFGGVVLGRATRRVVSKTYDAVVSRLFRGLALSRDSRGRRRGGRRLRG